MSEAKAPWLILFHQIPPKPDYLRVKIGRRLQRVGAVSVKNSVYVLPDRPESLEDFQWIRTEVVAAGGDASICRAAFVDGLTDERVADLFRAARDADYAEIAESARELLGTLRGRVSDVSVQTQTEGELAKLRKRFAAVHAIDFCGSAGRDMADQTLKAVAQALEPPDTPVSQASAAVDRSAYRGRVWVTRAGVFVDRIASAWLIRRFIDRDARFKFVSDSGRRPAANELRFDMFEGEFTHEGDHCTFETLLDRFGLTDPALHAIAEIVHDIDLKDDKFGRDDASGIERVLSAIAAAHTSDQARIDRGSLVFDDLYTLFSRGVNAPEVST